MDDLYSRQSRTLDPEERRRSCASYEKRLYDEEVHFIMGFQCIGIVPHLARSGAGRSAPATSSTSSSTRSGSASSGRRTLYYVRFLDPDDHARQ